VSLVAQYCLKRKSFTARSCMRKLNSPAKYLTLNGFCHYSPCEWQCSFRSQSKYAMWRRTRKTMERSSLKRLLLSAFCLVPAFCAAMLLSGCGVNYHVCPADTIQDPSRPFAPCKMTAPAQPQRQ
jgi:hypothetical protein